MSKIKQSAAAVMLVAIYLKNIIINQNKYE